MGGGEGDDSEDDVNVDLEGLGLEDPEPLKDGGADELEEYNSEVCLYPDTLTWHFGTLPFPLP